MCRRAILMMPEGERPHPGRAYRGCTCFQDSADYRAIGNHVVVVITPFAGSACGGGLDDEIVFVHVPHSIDTWTPDGESIVEHVAGVEDYQVALATYRAACERWPGTPITLRQGARVIEDSRRLRVVSSQ